MGFLIATRHVYLNYFSFQCYCTLTISDNRLELKVTIDDKYKYVCKPENLICKLLLYIFGNLAVSR